MNDNVYDVLYAVPDRRKMLAKNGLGTFTAISELTFVEFWRRGCKVGGAAGGGTVLYLLDDVELIAQAMIARGLRFKDCDPKLLLNDDLEKLGLPARYHGLLRRNGIRTKGALVQLTPRDILDIQNAGKEMLFAVQRALAAKGLRLRDN